jgi:hypothetical protein
MDIKQVYREETDLDVYADFSKEAGFSTAYVKWLEAKINYTHCCTEVCEDETHETKGKLEDVYRCECDKLKIY